MEQASWISADWRIDSSSFTCDTNCMKEQWLEFSAEIWLWNNGKNPASWHFVTIDSSLSQKIQDITKNQPRKGFGSVKVEVRIAFVVWQTSIFPDKASGCYLLPLKASVRKELQIAEWDTVLVSLSIL